MTATVRDRTDCVKRGGWGGRQPRLFLNFRIKGRGVKNEGHSFRITIRFRKAVC